MNCQRCGWLICFRILHILITCPHRLRPTASLEVFRAGCIVDISGPLLPLSAESPVIQDLVVCTRSTLSLTPYHAFDHVMLIYNLW